MDLPCSAHLCMFEQVSMVNRMLFGAVLRGGRGEEIEKEVTELTLLKKIQNYH